jgi:hypothetical protein
MSNTIAGAFELDMVPEKTLAEFMMSDQRVRAVRGPIGSGKSTVMALELFRRMVEQAPGKDGIRKTQMCITRNTLSQLKTTCLVTVQNLFGQICRYKPSTSEILFEFDDVKSSWLLLPLDTPQNIQRLLSLELTVAWVSEFREIRPEIVHAIYSRCGRFPSRLHGGATFYGMILETNSFAEDSEWFDVLEVDLPSNWGYFIQPPGVTVTYAIDDLSESEPIILTTGENGEYLPETYYTDMIESNGGLDSYFVRQYIFNEIAPSVAGEAVFRENFSNKFHVSDYELHPVDHMPLCIGVDGGRHPAAVITQLQGDGRVKVLGEVYGDNMGMEVFTTTILKPLLATDRYRGLPMFLVLDPSARNKSEVGEENLLQAYKRFGFVAVLATTNAIQPRLRIVDQWLQLTMQGKPALEFCCANCPNLTLSMGSRYRFKKRQDGSLDMAKPEKLHPWSEMADCLQYALLGGNDRVRARALRTIDRPTNLSYQEVPTGAWT